MGGPVRRPDLPGLLRGKSARHDLVFDHQRHGEEEPQGLDERARRTNGSCTRLRRNFRREVESAGIVNYLVQNEKQNKKVCLSLTIALQNELQNEPHHKK